MANGFGKSNGSAMVSAAVRFGRGQSKRKAAATKFWHLRSKRGLKVARTSFQGIDPFGRPIWS